MSFFEAVGMIYMTITAAIGTAAVVAIIKDRITIVVNKDGKNSNG